MSEPCVLPLAEWVERRLGWTVEGPGGTWFLEVFEDSAEEAIKEWASLTNVEYAAQCKPVYVEVRRADPMAAPVAPLGEESR